MRARYPEGWEIEPGVEYDEPALFIVPEEQIYRCARAS
jgi:hypothetical protein